MSLPGTWNMSISTPIGRQTAVLQLTEYDGVVVGVAKNGTKIMPLTVIRLFHLPIYSLFAYAIPRPKAPVIHPWG
jgi:hypothetical protein